MSRENLCFACAKEISAPLLYCDSCLANISPESVCEHGSLKRSCAVCEVVAERDALLAERDAEIARLTAEIEATELSRAHWERGHRIVCENLAAERQRARLPDDLVKRAKALIGSHHVYASSEIDLLADILAAVEQKP